MQVSPVRFGGVLLRADLLQHGTDRLGDPLAGLSANFFDSKLVGEKPGAVYFETIYGDKFVVERNNPVVASYTHKLSEMGGFSNMHKGCSFLNDLYSKCELWEEARQRTMNLVWMPRSRKGEFMFESLYGQDNGSNNRLKHLITDSFGLDVNANENGRSIFIDKEAVLFKAAPTIDRNDVYAQSGAVA